MDLSRRDFMKTAATGSLAIGSASLLSACGVNAAAITAPVHRASGPPKRGGTLRAAITGGSSADTLDPLSSVSNADFARVNNLFEPLLGLTPDAQPVFVLADELTPNATATEWVLRLKPGITFHNGKSLTADDVIYTFRTVLNPKAPAAAAAGLASIDAKGMAKLDPLTVRIPCRTPFATLHQALAIPTYSDVIPVGFNPKAPVGTGPFKLQSFTPGVQSTFVRYGNYWQTGVPYLDQVVITDYTDQTSQVNALLSG
jgi:peptide/nickel transport system substrate-binding protein